MESDDQEGQTFTIRGRQVTISRADVLAATFRKQPGAEHTRKASHSVVLRRDRVPTKWAVLTTLEHLEDQGRGNAERVPGKLITTAQAASIMRRLGFNPSADRAPRQ